VAANTGARLSHFEFLGTLLGTSALLSIDAALAYGVIFVSFYSYIDESESFSGYEQRG
jgi:hypothetical protein